MQGPGTRGETSVSHRLSFLWKPVSGHRAGRVRVPETAAGGDSKCHPEAASSPAEPAGRREVPAPSRARDTGREHPEFRGQQAREEDRELVLMFLILYVSVQAFEIQCLALSKRWVTLSWTR